MPLAKSLQVSRSAWDHDIMWNDDARQRFVSRDPDELFALRRGAMYLFHPQKPKMEVFVYDRTDMDLYLNDCVTLLLSCVLAGRNGFGIHGAGFVIGGGAAAVIGPSGAGKSTAARLAGYDWLLSDDALAVTDTDTTPRLWATPFGGRTDGPRSAPLRALFFPRKGEIFAISPIPARDAFLRYWAEHSEYLCQMWPSLARLIFESAHTLFHKVPSYELCFPRDYVDVEQIRRLLVEPVPTSFSF